MPKIDPKADFVIAKGWATAHVVLACAICAAVGLIIGLLLG